jgi:hypothetical protein
MSFLKKLFALGTNSPKPKADTLESILIVEDQALYYAIRDASEEERYQVSIAVARHAVASTGLQHSAVEDAICCLKNRERPSIALISAVERLADDFDIEDSRLQEERVGGEPGEEEQAAFHQARAASCILSVLSGRADEAVYEAIHATEDLPKMREIVLSVLNKT